MHLFYHIPDVQSPDSSSGQLPWSKNASFVSLKPSLFDVKQVEKNQRHCMWLFYQRAGVVSAIRLGALCGQAGTAPHLLLWLGVQK